MAGYRRDWAVALGRPQPGEYRSLALAASLRVTPDAALLDRVEALRRELTTGFLALKPEEAETARDERVKSFLTAEAPGAEGLVRVTRALLTVGASSTPTGDSVNQLDRILRGVVARLGPGGVLPAESLTLRRLAEQAVAWPSGSGPSDWPADAAQKLLLLADRAAEAGARPRSHAWIGSMLDEAALQRHDAEILFRERDCATLDAARETHDYGLASGYDSALAAGNHLESARDTLTAALDLLPDLVDRLDDIDQIEEVWRAAVGRARSLAARLQAPATAFRSAAELAPTSDGISQHTVDLGDDMDTLRGAIDRRIGTLIAPSAEDRAPERRGADEQAIDRLLASPLPTAEQRRGLWQAARRVARPLLTATLARDERAGASLAAEEVDSSGTSSDDESDESVPTSNDARPEPLLAPKARRALAILGLAGAPEKVLTALEAKLQPDPATVPAAYRALSRGLRTAWDTLIEPEQPSESVGPDVLGLVLPALESSPVLHVPKRSPYVLTRARSWESLWLRLADRYELEANDLGGDRALAETAAWLRDLTDRMLADLSLAPANRDPNHTSAVSPFPQTEPASVALSRDKPSAQLAVRLRDDDATPPWDVAPIAVDAHWLAIRKVALTDGVSTTADRLNWLVELGVDPAGGGVAPSGFLLRAARPGRHFFQRIPVSFDLDATQPRVILSANPEAPTAPRRELRLRPIPGVQPIHLYIGNPGDRDRKLLVELQVGKRAVIGGTGLVALGRGETRKIEFANPAPAATPAPAPTPAADTTTAPVVLPELAGPLTVILRDPATNRTLVVQTIPVGLASPLEYVSVDSARFEPAGPLTAGKNRLTVTLRAGANFSGPPCVARLVLSPERIVGLSTVQDTTSKGALTKPGDLLTLTAEGLVLADTDAEGGTFTVDLDGVPRALVFRGSFPRRGGATTPVLDFTPALRAKAADVTATGGHYALVTEPDNAPSDARLEIRLGRSGLAGFEPDRDLPVLPSPRHRRIGFALRDKALAFTAEVSDWVVPIDTEGVEGRRQIQIRLVNEARTIRELILPLAVDRSAARGVQILDPPRYAKPGVTLRIRATGDPSTSGTKEVVFFPGKPTADGKIPPGVPTISARISEDDPKVWEAALALPEKKGPTEISVAFVNAVGLASFDTASVELTDADLTEPGRIAGRITEGGVGQPDLAVLLADEKGFQKAATKTNASGQYTIEGVPPAEYRVLSRKPATPSKGDVVIEVKSGRLTTADLNLIYGR